MPEKELRTIFVIMPFTKTPTRNKAQLTAFFDEHLKKSIEKGRFKFKYSVRRSDDTFNITENIITDVYNADIVICDLSGKESNPNVMYELGMRLALTHSPVILIREANKDNRSIFDIGGFFAHPYDPLNYTPLLAHIKSKIKKLETGEEAYKSPVLAILEQDSPLLLQMSIWRAREKLMFMSTGLLTLLGLFSAHLMSYFKEKGIEISLGGNIDEIIPNINKNKDAFDKIDCSGFHCTLASQPMIDSYLSEQYLNNMADSGIVAPLTLQLISYHAHYLGMDVFHYRWSPNYLYVFFGETYILLTMIAAARSSIGKTGAELQECIERMDELRNESKFVASP